MWAERLLSPRFFRINSSPDRDYLPSSYTSERKKHERYFRQFTLPQEEVDKLSENQRVILFNLLKAADYGEKIFARQAGEGFYPEGVPKREIEMAARTSPLINDHYTVVKGTSGNLTAQPFHQYYPETQDISKYLKKAADAAGRGKERDNYLQAYLRAKATSFTTGNYEFSEKIWLERPNEPKLDVVIGYYDANTDKLFGRKFAFWASIGLLDQDKTKDSQSFLDSYLKSWEEEANHQAPMIKMRIDHTIALTGQAVEYGWTANSLPCQPEWRAKYGSKFIIWEPVFEDGFQEKLKAFKNVVDPLKRVGVSEELLKKIILRKFIAHEASHSLGISADLDHRFGRHASWVKELYCELLSLWGYRRTKGLNPSARESQNALAITLAEGSLEYNTFKRNGRREEYYIANSTILTYCHNKGSVRIKGGHLTWDNSNQVMDDIEELLKLVNNLMKEDKEREALVFLHEHYNPEIYDGVSYKSTSSTPLISPRAHRAAQL